jgi:hypothetical protein
VGIVFVEEETMRWKELQAHMMRLVLGAVLASLLLLSCGDAASENPPGSQSTGGEGGTARFEIVSSWEPTLDETKNGTRIGYSLIMANQGSASGKVSCEILMKGEPLPGESTTVTIEPGAEGTVDGEARTELKAEDVTLEDLTPRCR